MTAAEAKAKLFEPQSAPLDFDGVTYEVVEPPIDVLEASMALPTLRERAAAVAAASLRFGGAPVFAGPWEALRLPLSKAKLPQLVMDAVLELASPKQPVPGVDVAAGSPEEVLAHQPH